MAAGILALVVRLGVFLGALALLPRRMVPLSAHAAIGVALLLLALPAFSLEGASGASALITMHREPISYDIRVILLEATVGLILAVAVSASAYGARIGARWVSVTACGAHHDALSRGADPSLEPQLRRIEFLFILVFVVALFSSPGIVASVFGLCVDSLAPSTVRGIFSGEGETLRGIVSYVGSSAFTMALLFALPAFVISLSVDFCALVVSRFSPASASTSTVSAIAFPLILLVLSLCLYPFVASVQSRLEETTSVGYVETTLEKPLVPPNE